MKSWLIHTARPLIVCILLLLLPGRSHAEQPNFTDLDAAINSGDFGEYSTSISASLNAKLPLHPNGLSEASLKDLLMDPVFANTLAQRQLIEKETKDMKLSLFSVSYAGYWGQHKLDTLAFIAKAAELGYDSVMLAGKRPHLSPLDANPGLLVAIQAALDEHGIGCDVVGGYTDLSPAAAAEVPYLEMQIAYVESLARAAAALGASVVRVFTAYEVDGHSPHAIWNGVVRTLQEMCDRAAAHGVTLAVQNHHDIGVHTDWLLEILGDVDRPNCKVGFDAWSPALRGEDLYQAARKMAPHTVITTNADYVRLSRFRYQPAFVNYRKEEPDLVRAVKFGEGFIDYEAFFRGLQEGGFDGIANYEMCSPVRGGGELENLDAYAAHYLRWMREKMIRGK